ESFSWDVKGNMVAHRSSSNEWRERYLCWTEDNRLQAVKDNQMGAYYNYDASGERNLKLTGAVVQMSQNGVPYDYVILESPTLYASGLITINEKGYTKHYFEENKRVCSNIGGGFRDAGYDITDPIELITPFVDQWSNAKDGIFKTFDECIKSPVDLENTNDKILKVMKDHEKDRNDAEYQFYYTNDHLGSSTYITNQQGQITQTLAYLPYGEDWVDLDNQPPYITPYRFNGKEKDEETGYQYFGARYLNPTLSIWLSVDPMSDKYPHLTSYNYCANNPVMLIDPDGRDIDPETSEAAKADIERYTTEMIDGKKNKDYQPKFAELYNKWKGDHSISVKFTTISGGEDGGTVDYTYHPNDKIKDHYEVSYDPSITDKLGTSALFEESAHLNDGLNGGYEIKNGNKGYGIENEVTAKTWVINNISNIKTHFNDEGGMRQETHFGYFKNNPKDMARKLGEGAYVRRRDFIGQYEYRIYGTGGDKYKAYYNKSKNK
ncbi:MAG: type secretion protein Rhs, partial [Bacteroidetes bacterium]|nr:type secretion protein Rhs [Bacteroidota bacterium]